MSSSTSHRSPNRPWLSFLIWIVILCLATTAYLYFVQGWFKPKPSIHNLHLDLQDNAEIQSKAVLFMPLSALDKTQQSTADILAHAVAYKAADIPLPMASLTKIMTCLLGCESNITDDAIFEIDTDGYLKMVEEDASMAGFYGGERVTFKDLLYGTMLASGGETAVSLAIAVAGNETAFVAQMNAKAKALGLSQTLFKNPTGLDEPGHQSTAYDLALLTKAALENPRFKTLFTTPKLQSSATSSHPEGILWQNHVYQNAHQYDLMPAGYDVQGGKAGFTDHAGYCWASYLTVQNEDFVCITLGAPKMPGPPAQVQELARICQLIETSIGAKHTTAP